MKEVNKPIERSFSQKEWQTTIRQIRDWTFDNWAKPDLLGPLGQTIDIQKKSRGIVYRVRVQRYLNRINIDLTETKNGTETYIFKDLYRKRTDVGRIIFDPEKKDFRQVLSRRTKSPKYFLEFLDAAGRLP